VPAEAFVIKPCETAKTTFIALMLPTTSPRDNEAANEATQEPEMRHAAVPEVANEAPDPESPPKNVAV
jgi:hypothetical protein